MSTTVPFYNLIFLGVLGFGVLLFFLGLFGKKGAISILRNENTTTTVLMAVGGALFCGALVVWGTMDLLSGPKDSLIIAWVKNLADSILNQSMNPWSAPK